MRPSGRALTLEAWHYGALSELGPYRTGRAVFFPLRWFYNNGQHSDVRFAGAIGIRMSEGHGIAYGILTWHALFRLGTLIRFSAITFLWTWFLLPTHSLTGLRLEGTV